MIQLVTSTFLNPIERLEGICAQEVVFLINIRTKGGGAKEI
jgi:hypothetical protein